MLLYNTLERKKQPFSPAIKNNVSLYACGPTVYDFTHIGHIRAYIFVDILRRVLLYNGFGLKHVMNITDVGHLTDDADTGKDKLEQKAMQEKQTVWDIAEQYTRDFFETMDAVNVERPDIICKATEHIGEMIALIQKIEENGYSYRTSDGIYFDTFRLVDYGKLARLDLDSLQEGARVEPNPEKRNPTDFALWKFSNPNEKRQMEWGSPWGRGFPGWHIECTAMGVKYLGETIDIHTGGIDHIPVHHTNEIAQAQGAYGKDIVRFWLHNEFMMVDGAKMSKSKGNFYRLPDIKTRGISPIALRYFFLQAHYRSPVNFTWESLQAAHKGIMNLRDKVQNSKLKTQNHNLKLKTDYSKRFLEAINDDLNTSQALAVLWDTLKDTAVSDEEKRALAKDFDRVFGLGLGDEKQTDSPVNLPEEIKNLAVKREEARSRGDYALSDNLRQKIEKLGYKVQDTKDGQRVVLNFI